MNDHLAQPGTADSSATCERVDMPASAVTRDEIRRAFFRPDLQCEIVLAGRDRLVANLITNQHLGWLTLLLLTVSLVMTVPFGLITPDAPWCSVAAFFVGPLLICVPSLFVFGRFLGLPLDIARTSASVLILSAVAALFSFGFFPIVWFIDLSTDAVVGPTVEPSDLAILCLYVAFVLGGFRMCQVLGRMAKDREGAALSSAILLLWLPLLVFIAGRMATLVRLK